jgi:hypothetical protein
MLSSSVPSPYVRARFGFRSILAAEDGGGLCTSAGRFESVEDGRRTMGDAGRDSFAEPSGVPENTEEMAGRAFKREDDVGIVSLTATGLLDGVVGRVGGTM